MISLLGPVNSLRKILLQSQLGSFLSFLGDDEFAIGACKIPLKYLVGFGGAACEMDPPLEQAMDEY